MELIRQRDSKPRAATILYSQAGGGHLPVVVTSPRYTTRKGDIRGDHRHGSSEQKRAEAELRDAMKSLLARPAADGRDLSLRTSPAGLRSEVALGSASVETHITGMDRGGGLRACGSKRGPSRRAGLRCFGTRDKFRIGGIASTPNDGADERSAELGAMCGR